MGKTVLINDVPEWNGGTAQVTGTALRCPRCGLQAEPGDLFCMDCGARLDGGAAGVQAHATRPGQSANPTHTVMVEPQNTVKQQSERVYPDDGRLVPVVSDADDDHPTARNKLLRLTQEEARRGCRKTLQVDGRDVVIDVPAGVSNYAKYDLPGYGYKDKATGGYGPLRLSIRVV